METVVIDNVTFTKAKDLARHFGYTSDYIGQLCRAGKVESKLVGRTWYVTKDSLLSHKNNRYQGTQADARVSESRESSKASSYATKTFYTYAKSPVYDRDEADLLPHLEGKSEAKPTGVTQPEPAAHKLSIGLADATPVQVNSKSEEFVFEQPKQRDLVFKGDLRVVDLEDSSYYKSDRVAPVSTHKYPEKLANTRDSVKITRSQASKKQTKKKLEGGSVVKIKKLKVGRKIKTNATVQAPIEKASTATPAQTTLKKNIRTRTSGVVPLTKLNDVALPEDNSWATVAVTSFLAVFVGIGVGLFLVFAEQEVVVSSQTATSAYSVDWVEVRDWFWNRF